MNKYVVAFLSLYVGELKQEIVEATSAVEAAISYLNWWEDETPPKTMDEVHEIVGDGDSFIHVLDITNIRNSPPGSYNISIARTR